MQHLYVHVPFCSRRCSYCDFAIAVRRQVPASRYVAAVLKEHELKRLRGAWDSAPLETLYLGGGTPSKLPPEQVARLVTHFLARDSSEATIPQRSSPLFTGPHQPGLARLGCVQPEVTLEVNPEDVSPHAVEIWLSAGVNRVSLGVQSFDQHVLEWMHRTHRAQQAIDAVRLLQQSRIGSVSVDLIFALPREVRGHFETDLHRAVELGPDHISAYGLTVEPRTPLSRWIARGDTVPAAEGSYADEFILAHEILSGAGYDHYEVSSYARPGHESQHNGAYWCGGPYGALGPAAHSFDGVERHWNVRNWAEYERVVAGGDLPVAGRERLTPDQRRLERVYLSLRTAKGLPDDGLGDLEPTVLEAALDSGWMAIAAGLARLTPAGWLRLDALVAALTTSGKGG
jgi:oxygen-independent coproporphyrinogen-3 oxidase